MTWYVCRVNSRQERRIVEALAEKGVDAYCPLQISWAKHATRKVHQARALSPGYVFVILPPDDGSINPRTGMSQFDEAVDIVRSDRRIKNIMCDGAGHPRRIPTAELRGIFILEMFHAFDETWAPPKRKRPKGQKYSHRWKAGDRVQIMAGAFKDWKGYVKEAKGRAMVVMLKAFGRENPVTVPHTDLMDAPAQDVAEPLAA